MEEIWKDVVGFEGLYQISSFGRVKSLERFYKCINGHKRFKKVCIMSPEYNTRYGKIIFIKERKIHSKMIHRLVAQAFIPNPENKPQVNHKDGNKRNNNVNNLEWMTPYENIHHALDNGLTPKCKGETHYQSIKVKCTNCGIIFNTMTEAAIHFKISRTHLRDFFLGKTKKNYSAIKM